MYNFLVHLLETLVFNAGTWKSQPFCLVGNFTLLQNLGMFWSPNKNHPKKEKLNLKKNYIYIYIFNMLPLIFF